MAYRVTEAPPHGTERYGFHHVSVQNDRDMVEMTVGGVDPEEIMENGDVYVMLRKDEVDELIAALLELRNGPSTVDRIGRLDSM